MSEIERRIKEYFSLGGLWNPELANHAAVRDLIRDCRAEITRLKALIEEAPHGANCHLGYCMKHGAQYQWPETGTVSWHCATRAELRQGCDYNQPCDCWKSKVKGGRG